MIEPRIYVDPPCHLIYHILTLQSFHPYYLFVYPAGNVFEVVFVDVEK